MIYQVYSDNNLIFDSEISSLALTKAQVELEVNAAGSFTFTMYPSHPRYNTLQRLKSIITVYQDSYLMFRGRLLDDQKGFHDEMQATCEGELAFLNDSIQRPYDFLSGENHTTISELFTYFITNHNAQVSAERQFIVGNITVTDGNDYIVKSDSTYMNTLESIKSKLIDSFGGYLQIRHEADGNYIDYLADFTTISNQKIQLGKNLLSLDKLTSGADVATAIIPLGATVEETGTRLTISSLADETTEDICKSGDCVYSIAAEAQYGGRITKTVTYDNVTTATALKSKAMALLAIQRQLSETIELTSADLSAIETNINAFHIGTYITVESEYHGVNENFLIKKLSVNILNPATNKLSIGRTRLTFTEHQVDTVKNLAALGENVQKVAADYSTLRTDLTQETSSLIAQSSEEIMTQVSENFYLKSEADELISSINTKFTQTNDSFEFQFNEFSKSLEDVASGADAQFKEISKYIRFVDGNIILGEDGNQITLKIQNDRISFLENGAEVAYFMNRKLYVNDGEFINSLKLGKFAFLPRANGNLSFKKVVD